jgi:flavorubredoxin
MTSTHTTAAPAIAAATAAPTFTKTRLEPTRIAPETYLIHDHAGEGHAPVLIPLNSMVIRGAEPIVVDTGVVDNRDQFLADVFSIVEPEDIRWVFISHDDVDHTGNVNALMALAPNATLVVNWFLQERMGATLEVSPMRQRWITDGEILDAGDRKLLAVRPPVYDSPTTRGLFDTTTGVYWTSDAFGAPMTTPVRDVAELPEGLFELGSATFNRYVAPWIEIADPGKYQESVDRIAALAPSLMVGCHSPVIRRSHVATAIDVMRRSPQAEILPMADQAVLDAIQLQMMAAAHA